MKTFIILPARMSSTRLPNKLIKKIGNKTLIEHMIITAKKIKDSLVIVSTDSSVIYDYAVKQGVEAFISKKPFKNGTERCYYTAEYYNARPSDIVINLQADEFNISVANINSLIEKLKKSNTESIATLIYKSSDDKEYSNVNNVKVIIDKDSRAVTFTRKKITSIPSSYLIHLGVYAFKFKALSMYNDLPPCYYEKEESLEQLRLIWNNVPICCVQAKNNKSIGINSASDLKKARELYGN